MGSLSAVQTTAAVLTSWKDIARYMGKGVRTVQRWEMDFGLPVRRPHGSNKKAVLARPRDLDAWIALRCTSRANDLTAVGKELSRALCMVSLKSEIETSRQLRQSNRLLLGEMQNELEELRRNLVEMHLGGGRIRPQTPRICFPDTENCRCARAAHAGARESRL